VGVPGDLAVREDDTAGVARDFGHALRDRRDGDDEDIALTDELRVHVDLLRVTGSGRAVPPGRASSRAGGRTIRWRIERPCPEKPAGEPARDAPGMGWAARPSEATVKRLELSALVPAVGPQARKVGAPRSRGWAVVIQVKAD
jgi:hypothetical protein